jgi:tetratricopeptide (TPR) repeat protein
MADTSPTPRPLPPHVLARVDVRQALEHHDFGRLFRLARKWGGVSFLKIADACEIKPERVGRLARGKGNITSYAKIAAIADGLRVPGHLIGLAPRPWENHSNPEAAPKSEGEGVQRRAFLLTASLATAAASTPGVSPLSQPRGRIGNAAIERLRERTARLRRLDDYLGGGETYPLYVAELRSTTSLARNASYATPTGRALLAIAAEQAQQAGWAAFDAGHHAEAEHLYKTALMAATDADDRPLIANSLALLAYQQASNAPTGTRRSGVDLATASCDRAGTDAHPAVHALLFGRCAWAHARAGEERAAHHALTRAEEARARASSSPDPGPDWATWVDDRELRIMAGRCWTELGRPLRAIPQLEEALRDFPDAQARDKALYLSWLAHAYLDVGEREHAATVLCRSLELAYGVGSVRPQERAQQLLVRLDGHEALPTATDTPARLEA